MSGILGSRIKDQHATRDSDQEGKRKCLSESGCHLSRLSC
jgi:hypothetical protein